MSKNRHFYILITIFVLALFAGIISFPGFFNQQINSFNKRFGFNLSHFKNIPFQLGLDLQGGAHLVYQADLEEIELEDRSERMVSLRDIIAGRIDHFGVREPLVQVQGERLIVEIAGVIDVNEAIRIIGETPFLEFRELKDEEEIQKISAKQAEIREKVGKESWEGITEEDWGKIQEIEDWQIAFESIYKPTILTGAYLDLRDAAKIGFDSPIPTPIVLLRFNREGAEIFEEMTVRNIGRPIAIYIDGEEISRPIVQEAIGGGEARITGDFTVEEARELVRNLNTGALPVKIELISQQIVGPILGEISLQQSLKAGVVGFLLIALLLIFIYRLPGFLSVVSLLIYCVLILALLKLFPVTLTLAGIAGFILSIGMAVDANILIFSRIREEINEGKRLGIAVEQGSQRAWPSIRDGNLTTFLTAFILYFVGTGFVRGFGFTLGLGILISMFSAIFITQNLLRCFIGARFEKIKWLWR